MNPGKTSIDDKIDKLNAKIAKLLGKPTKNKPNFSDNNKSNNDTHDDISDTAYILITVICFLFLWFATGVYYINNGTYALISKNGKFVQQVNGAKFGVTYPYPFGSVDIISSEASEMIPIGSASGFGADYNSLTKDLLLIHTTAQFSYKITDPQKLYNHYVIDPDNVESLVSWSLQAGFHNYIASKTYLELHTSNLTLMGNNIKNITNQELASYGLELVKFNISKLQESTVKEVIIAPSAISYKNTNNIESGRIFSRDVIRNRVELR